MRIGEAFPSEYLKASDLQGRTVKAVISNVEMKDIGSDHKPVLYFKGKEKGLVLNKTNANTIALVYGDDTQDWDGGEVELYPTRVDFQGRQVDAIRVKIPPRRPGAAAAPAAPSAGNGATRTGDPIDDDIPF